MYLLSGQQSHYVLCLRNQHLLSRIRYNSEAAKLRASPTILGPTPEAPVRPLLIPNGKPIFFYKDFIFISGATCLTVLVIRGAVWILWIRLLSGEGQIQHTAKKDSLTYWQAHAEMRNSWLGISHTLPNKMPHPECLIWTFIWSCPQNLSYLKWKYSR